MYNQEAVGSTEPILASNPDLDATKKIEKYLEENASGGEKALAKALSKLPKDLQDKYSPILGKALVYSMFMKETDGVNKPDSILAGSMSILIESYTDGLTDEEMKNMTPTERNKQIANGGLLYFSNERAIKGIESYSMMVNEQFDKWGKEKFGKPITTHEEEKPQIPDFTTI